MRGGGAPAAADALDVVATTGQAADFAREVGGERVRRHRAARSERRSARVRDPSRRRQGAAPAPTSSSAPAAISTSGSTERSRAPAPMRRSSTLADGVELDGDDPHWWQDPRNAVAAVAALRDALIEADPAGADAYRRAAAAYTERLERLDRAVERCIAKVPSADRTLVTTHDSLGYYARRYGIRVVGAVIPSRSTVAQPSAGEIAALVETIRRERREGDLRRELGQSRRRGGDRARVRRAHRARAVGRHAGSGGLGRRHLRRLDRLEHRRARRGVQRRRDRLPARGADARPLRSVRPARAARDAAARGARRPARELDRAAPARLLRPCGRHGRASPALVLASAWGIAPQLAALAAALGFGVAQERLARTRRLGADAATGLLLVGALAAGVVLASDVFESGAEVDTLLFGSLIGLSASDVWLTALVAAGVVALDAGAAAALARDRLRAGRRPRARAASGAGRPAAAGRDRGDGGRRARRRRGAARDGRARRPRGHRAAADRPAGAAAARRDRARGRRGRRARSGWPTRSTSARVRRWRCSAAACSPLVAGATALRARAVPA